MTCKCCQTKADRELEYDPSNGKVAIERAREALKEGGGVEVSNGT